MFVTSSDALSMRLLGNDPAAAVARHFGLRSKGWTEAGYNASPAHKRAETANFLAESLGGTDDLRFVVLDYVFPGSPERLEAFRARTGLELPKILRRPVISDGASTQDWAALFDFAMEFPWDSVVVSRHRHALVWISHDEFLRATPPSLLRSV